MRLQFDQLRRFWWVVLLTAIAAALEIFGAIAHGADAPHPAVCRVVSTGPATRRVIPGVGLVDAQEASVGTGTLIRSAGGRGLVITCWHIFRDSPAGAISTTWPDGQSSPARIVASDPLWDLALLETAAPRGIRPIPLASADLVAGQPVRLGGLGRPSIEAQVLGYRAPRVGSPHSLLVATAEVRDGDSGAPMLNSAGELTGVIWGTAYRETVGSCVGRIRRVFGGCVSQSSPWSTGSACQRGNCQPQTCNPIAAPPSRPAYIVPPVPSIGPGYSTQPANPAPLVPVIPAPPEPDPVTPAPAKPPRSVDVDLDRLVELIVARLPKPEKGEKGEKGDQGPPGEGGGADELAVQRNRDAIAILRRELEALDGRVDQIEVDLREVTLEAQRAAQAAEGAQRTADAAKRAADENARQIRDLAIRIQKVEGLDVKKLVAEAIGGGSLKFRLQFDRNGRLISLTPRE